jgi:hypothetical protein
VSCVSRAELLRFVAHAQATLAFEAHVDGCPRCAGALAQLARTALAPPAARGFPAEAALVALALAVAVMAWPRPVLDVDGAPRGAEAGVPEAAAWLDPAPVAVAALDGGRGPSHRGP